VNVYDVQGRTYRVVNDLGDRLLVKQVFTDGDELYEGDVEVVERSRVYDNPLEHVVHTSVKRAKAQLEEISSQTAELRNEAARLRKEVRELRKGAFAPFVNFVDKRDFYLVYKFNPFVVKHVTGENIGEVEVTAFIGDRRRIQTTIQFGSSGPYMMMDKLEDVQKHIDYAIKESRKTPDLTDANKLTEMGIKIPAAAMNKAKKKDAARALKRLEDRKRELALAEKRLAEAERMVELFSPEN
jgi:hypothetical protein